MAGIDPLLLMVAISTFFPNASFKIGLISDVSMCMTTIDDDDDDDGEGDDDEAAAEGIVFFV